MKKKKTKQQNKTNKKNVFQIVALALISLVLLGAVIDVANDLVKEEDPTEDVLPDDEQPGEDEKEPEENPVQLATFRVGDKEYQFEEGMTWSQFVDSEYNVDNFYFQYPENDTVLMCGDSYICDGAPVDGGTLIVADRVYTS